MNGEAEFNVAVEEPHVGLKPKVRVVILALLLCASASFFIGDLLGEDGAGGMRGDFYCNHWPTIERFSQTPWSIAVVDYPTTSNPLLYMAASLLPLHDNPKIYHIISFTLGLLIWPFLSWAYYRRYSKYGIDWLWALFGASAILLSPSFRSSTFWGNTDWFPYVFCAGTSLLLSRFQDLENIKAPKSNLLLLISLAIVSSCAFYTRQYYAFVPVFTAWIVLTKTRTSFVQIAGVFFVIMLPEIYLLYIWKGFNTPSQQFMLVPATINFWKVGSVIGLLSFPVIVGCLRRSLSDLLPEWWGARLSVTAVAGLFVFIIIIMALGSPEWVEEGFGGGGGGIIVKAGLRMGALGDPFILTVSYFGLVAAALFAMSSVTNAVLAGTYLAPLFLTRPTYQRYLEPSLVVALFLFADTQTARKIFNKRVLVYNFGLTIAILTAGIIYYNFLHHGADIHSPLQCGDPHPRTNTADGHLRR